MKNLTRISLMLTVLPTLAFADGADIGSYLTAANTSPVVDSGHSLGSVWVKMNPLTVTASGTKQNVYTVNNTGGSGVSNLSLTVANSSGSTIYVYMSQSNSTSFPSGTSFGQVLNGATQPYNLMLGVSNSQLNGFGTTPIYLYVSTQNISTNTSYQILPVCGNAFTTTNIASSTGNIITINNNATSNSATLQVTGSSCGVVFN